MQIFKVDKLRINDNWYCEENGVFHTYFLEYPEDAPLDERCWSTQTVGHAVSGDLVNWEYKGTVLTPEKDIWNDKGIATGSNVKMDGKWYMLYTGNSYTCGGGFGLAVSEDLHNWRRVGDSPVIDRSQPFDFEFEGKPVKVKLLADPYVYPEQFDGWFYAYFNAMIDGMGINDGGAQAIMKSKDLINWVPHKIACKADCNRIETSHVWKHGDKWYMYGGEVTVLLDENGNPNGQNAVNTFYVSDKCDEGFKEICKPEWNEFFYIAKVINDKSGNEVFIANNPPVGLIGPYKLEYSEDCVKIVK